MPLTIPEPILRDSDLSMVEKATLAALQKMAVSGDHEPFRPGELAIAAGCSFTDVIAALTGLSKKKKIPEPPKAWAEVGTLLIDGIFIELAFDQKAMDLGDAAASREAIPGYDFLTVGEDRFFFRLDPRDGGGFEMSVYRIVGADAPDGVSIDTPDGQSFLALLGTQAKFESVPSAWEWVDGPWMKIQQRESGKSEGDAPKPSTKAKKPKAE